jgi:hypothetical protein
MVTHVSRLPSRKALSVAFHVAHDIGGDGVVPFADVDAWLLSLYARVAPDLGIDFVRKPCGLQELGFWVLADRSFSLGQI